MNGGLIKLYDQRTPLRAIPGQARPSSARSLNSKFALAFKQDAISLVINMQHLSSPYGQGRNFWVIACLNKPQIAHAGAYLVSKLMSRAEVCHGKCGFHRELGLVPALARPVVSKPLPSPYCRIFKLWTLKSKFLGDSPLLNHRQPMQGCPQHFSRV